MLIEMRINGELVRLNVETELKVPIEDAKVLANMFREDLNYIAHDSELITLHILEK